MLITSEEALVRRVTLNAPSLYDTAMRAVRTKEQRERLLVFTDDVSESPVRAALERGVRGFLVYGYTADELIAAVRSLDRNQSLSRRRQV
jgi:DNA-binding NarL/FixJ family response regulator